MDEQKIYTYSDLQKAQEGGRKMGQEHSHSSPDTIKLIDDLQKTIEVNCNQMQNIEKKVDTGFSEIKETLKEISCKLDQKADRNETQETAKKLSEETQLVAKTLAETKANRWTEDLLKGVLIAIGLGLLGLVGTLIINAIIHFSKGI